MNQLKDPNQENDKRIDIFETQVWWIRIVEK